MLAKQLLCATAVNPGDLLVTLVPCFLKCNTGIEIHPITRSDRRGPRRRCLFWFLLITLRSLGNNAPNKTPHSVADYMHPQLRSGRAKTGCHDWLTRNAGADPPSLCIPDPTPQRHKSNVSKLQNRGGLSPDPLYSNLRTFFQYRPIDTVLGVKVEMRSWGSGGRRAHVLEKKSRQRIWGPVLTLLLRPSVIPSKLYSPWNVGLWTPKALPVL